ncbi:MAG: helix-turn-helix transcriptional regulator [Clostridiales bacterium]|nr:helix-turn-helix transcriptional regulator [Clostridiales bacterium]
MITQALRKLRLLNNYTQKQVAEVLNIDRSTYAYYESGKTKPDLAQLAKLARLYSVSIDHILGISADADMLYDSNNKSPYYFENAAKKLAALSDDEKRLVLLYRSCEDKNAVLDIVRKHAINESESDR